MYDIETTPKDVDGNLSFSSNKMMEWTRSRSVNLSRICIYFGVDSALNYIIQIDNFETGTGSNSCIGAGDVWTADFSAPVSVSSGLATPDPNMYSPVGTYHLEQVVESIWWRSVWWWRPITGHAIFTLGDELVMVLVIILFCLKALLDQKPDIKYSKLF